jgi:G:T-mismatch repair DNA endonuclease (very short patch repair protein)
MQQIKTLKCQLCDFTTTSQISLSKHTSFKHNLKFPDYLIQIKYDGNSPLCKCGCGEPTKYSPSEADFHKCLHGHQSRLEGHWGDLKSEKRVNAIIKTRKEKFANGEYNHIKEAIKETRKNPEFGKKISKTKQENPYKFSEESKVKMSKSRTGLKRSDETKKKMSETAIKNILKTGVVKTSKIEYIIKDILTEMGIRFIHSYYVKDTDFNKVYDFYIPEYEIFLEIHGDFWHCNPDTKFINPEYKTQYKNIENDKLKEEWVKNQNKKLFIIWESDINNNIEKVKQQLTEIFSKP